MAQVGADGNSSVMGIVYAECEATSKYNVTGGSNAFIALSFYKGKAFFITGKEHIQHMYNKVDTNLNFVEREKEVEKFWKENDIFKKSMENRKEGET